MTNRVPSLEDAAAFKENPKNNALGPTLEKYTLNLRTTYGKHPWNRRAMILARNYIYGDEANPTDAQLKAFERRFSKFFNYLHRRRKSPLPSRTREARRIAVGVRFLLVDSI